MKNKIKAYIDQQGQKTSNAKAAILNELKNSNQTLLTLAIALRKPQSTIAARLSDLHDAGLIVQVPTDNRLSEYRLATDDEIDLTRERRFIERFARWNKEGVESGFFNLLNGE